MVVGQVAFIILLCHFTIDYCLIFNQSRFIENEGHLGVLNKIYFYCALVLHPLDLCFVFELQCDGDKLSRNDSYIIPLWYDNLLQSYLAACQICIWFSVCFWYKDVFFFASWHFFNLEQTLVTYSCAVCTHQQILNAFFLHMVRQCTVSSECARCIALFSCQEICSHHGAILCVSHTTGIQLWDSSHNSGNRKSLSNPSLLL